MTSYGTLDQTARGQHGLVTGDQLISLGFTPAQLRVMLATGRLTSLRRGIYRLCGAEASWESAALAAVLAAGPGAVLSHRSAGVLWGFLDRHRETGPLEVIAPSQARLVAVTAHRHRLAPVEMTRRFAIPVTTAERTLLDLAQSTTHAELGRLCDEALRRRIATLARLRATVDGHRGRGRRRLLPIQAVLADRIPGYDPGANDWEQRMDRLWDRLGLPGAERQYRVRVGRRSYRIDRAIVDLKIAVEWNGFDPHGYRGHLDTDSDRRAALAAAGWHCLDFTAKSRPELICRAVLAVVNERRHLFGRAS
jgi:hypothetical protein